MIIPTSSTDSRMNMAKRQTLADFLYYSICQGQSLVGAVGYSSLPLNLVQASFDQTAKLKTADPRVDLTRRDVTTCNNPTFVKGNLSANHLAQIAPVIPACDHVGAGPCTGAGSSGTTGPPSNTGASASSSAAAGNTGTSGGGTQRPGASGISGQSGQPATGSGGAGTSTGGTDPVNGTQNAMAGSGTGADGSVTGVPTELAAYRQRDMSTLLAPLATVEMLAVLVLPPLFYFYVLRRHRSRRSQP
jgi:hypothetical protein